MLNVTITLLLIVLFVSLEIVKRTEKYQNIGENPIYIEDSVKVKGGIKLQFPTGTNKIKVNKLCVDNECINANVLNFVVNNKDFRNKLYCLGDACIDKRHMEILKGDRNFKLKHRNRGKCINIRDLDIHGKPLRGNEVHDDNDDGSTQFIPNALHIEDCNKDLTSMEFKLEPEPHYMATGYGSVLEGSDIPIDQSSVPPAQPSDINPPIDPKKFSITNELSSYGEDTE